MWYCLMGKLLNIYENKQWVDPVSSHEHASLNMKMCHHMFQFTVYFLRFLVICMWKNAINWSSVISKNLKRVLCLMGETIRELCIIYIYIYKVSYKITQCEIGECIKCIRHIDKLSYNMWIIHNYETHMLWKSRCIPWMRLLVKKKHFSCLTIA